MTKLWDKNKGTIKTLYLVQDKTLEETRKIMKESHNFNASTRTYRSRFKTWGWTKYNKKPRSSEAPVVAAPGGLQTTHEAPLMTPGPSFQGNAPNPTTYGIHSPRPTYAYGGRPVAHRNSIASPSSNAISPSFSHSQTQTPTQTPATASYCNSQGQGLPPYQMDPWPNYSYQQQQQQQQSSFRALQPASAYRQPQPLYVHTAASSFSQLLSPTDSPPALSMPTNEDDNSYALAGMHGTPGPSRSIPTTTSNQALSDFERYAQSGGYQPASTTTTQQFCRAILTCIQRGADTSRICPPALDQAILSPRPRGGQQQQTTPASTTDMAHAVASFQRRDSTAPVVVVVEPWVAVWISACRLSVEGDAAAVEDRLRALAVLMGGGGGGSNRRQRVDVQRVLRPLVFLGHQQQQQQQQQGVGSYASPRSAVVAAVAAEDGSGGWRHQQRRGGS